MVSSLEPCRGVDEGFGQPGADLAQDGNWLVQGPKAHVALGQILAVDPSPELGEGYSQVSQAAPHAPVDETSS